MVVRMETLYNKLQNIALAIDLDSRHQRWWWK